VLLKGMASSGGSVTFGAAAPVPLHDGVQRITVTSEGPVWASLQDAIFANGFQVP